MPAPVFLRCQSQNCAVDDAIRRSQARISSMPPVVQNPSMTAMEGVRMVSI